MVHKRMSFLSVAFVSLAAIVVTVVLSASGLAVYGLSIFDRRTDNVVGLVTEAVRSLPEFRESLPPALADALEDERQPGYLGHIEVTARLKGEPRRGIVRGVVTVTNRGKEIVTLLSMRVVGLDEDGDPTFERNTWAATPLQIDGDWRGPLLPGETRRFPVRCSRSEGAVELVHEITDIRVWRGAAEGSADQAAEAPREHHGERS